MRIAESTLAVILGMIVLSMGGCGTGTTAQDQSVQGPQAESNAPAQVPEATRARDGQGMEQIAFQEMFPVRVRRYDKKEVRFTTVDEICQYFRDAIEQHPFALYITTFDHYSHTKGLKDGFIDSGIIGAKNIVFCFGKDLKCPEVLSVRPRSIGICETDSQYVISFLEAPAAKATETMEGWVCGISEPAQGTQNVQAQEK